MISSNRPPRESYTDAEAIAQLRECIEMIGDYNKLFNREDGPSMIAVVDSVFGEQAVEDTLLKTAGWLNMKPRTEARESFLNFLIKNHGTETGKGFIRYSGDTHPSHAENANITMKKFLGKEGADLYKAAVAEEASSYAFRYAVAYKATKHYKGPKLTRPLFIWVGGASGSGKSYGASSAFQMLLNHMPNLGKDNVEGNYSVSIDNGIPRKLSQMWEIALKVVRRCGWSGIADIEDLSAPLDMKKLIKEMAVVSGRTSIIIPDTFADCLLNCPEVIESEKIAKQKGMYHIFFEVLPPTGQMEEFTKATVPRMANERAWSLEYGKANGRYVKYELNNPDDNPESKAPPIGVSITLGIHGTAVARGVYLGRGENTNIHLVIINDLMYQGNVRLSVRDFDAFRKALGNAGQLNLQHWYGNAKQNNQLAQPLIVVVSHHPI